MVSIIERGLEDEVLELSATAFNAASIVLEQQIGAGFSDTISLENVLIADSWATGTAGIGADISLRIGVEFEDGFSVDLADAIGNTMENVVEGGPVEVPPRLDETVGDIEFVVVDAERVGEGINLTLGRGASQTGVVIDILNNQVFTLEDGNVSTQSIEEFVDRSPEEIQPPTFEEVEGLEEAMGVFQTVEEEIEEEVERDEFPNIPRSFKPFATGPNNLEVKAGKETKSVEPREPYDFEVRMGLTTTQIRRFNQDEDRSITPRPLPNCVGVSIDLGGFGSRDPPANFPNTLEYIRQHLMNEGPSYALEIFNDLVLYGGFISQAHADEDGNPINLYASSYENVRNILGRIEKVQDEGLAPDLIRPIPQQDAEASGLDTTAKLPLNGGGEIEAPWLENRQYYEIVEENEDDEAWQDIHSLLYERATP